MNIPTKQVLKDYEGKEILNDEGKPLTVGVVISNVLNTAREGGVMKLYELARSATNDASLQVDKADLTLIKKLVEENNSYFVVIRGQVLSILEDVKEKK